MGDHFKELLNKKNLINLAILLLLVLGIPLAVQLARTQQIFHSNAAAVEPNLEFRGSCITTQGGATVATCKDVKIKLTPPWPVRPTSQILRDALNQLAAAVSNIHFVTPAFAQTVAPGCHLPGYSDGFCGSSNTSSSSVPGYTCSGYSQGLGFIGCTGQLPFCWTGCTASTGTTPTAPITGTPSISSCTVSPGSVAAGSAVTISATGTNVDHIDLSDVNPSGVWTYLTSLHPSGSYTWTTAGSTPSGAHTIVCTPFNNADNNASGSKGADSNAALTVTGGGSGGGSCPDDCFSSDLRTNVGTNPTSGRCDSGSASTSHFCTTAGVTQACNNSMYVCKAGGIWSPQNASVAPTDRQITINIQADLIGSAKSNQDVTIPFTTSGANYVNLKVDGAESWGTGCGAGGAQPCPKQVPASAGQIVWPANHASRVGGPKAYTVSLKAYYCEGDNCSGGVESQTKTITIESGTGQTTNCAANSGICAGNRADGTGISTDGRSICTASGYRSDLTGCDPGFYCFLGSSCSANPNPGAPLGGPQCSARVQRSCVDADGNSGTQYCAVASDASSCNPGSCYKTLTSLDQGCAIDASHPSLNNIWSGNKLRQSVISANGRDLYVRTCNLDATAGASGVNWGSCTRWQKSSLSSLISGTGKFISYDTFMAIDGTTKVVYESLLADDGVTSFSRRCPATNTAEGEDCSAATWQRISLASADVAPKANGKYRAIDGFVARDGNTFFLNQSLIDDDGHTGYVRRCALDSTAGGSGINWDSCKTAWGTVDLAAAGVGPKTGGRFRSLDSFVVKDGTNYLLYQSMIDENGIDSWTRKCTLDSTAGMAGVNYAGCGTWQPVNIKRTIMDNVAQMIQDATLAVTTLWRSII